MRKPDESHCLFCDGNTFYFSVNMPPRANQRVLPYEGYIYRGIGDGHIAELEFVKKEGRIGVFLLEKGDEDFGRFLYKATTFPFIFDEVWIPYFTEYNDVYLAVRIGEKWGVIRLYDDHNYQPVFKGWCVPWEHATRQSAINAIRAKYDKSRLQWVKIDNADELEETAINTPLAQSQNNVTTTAVGHNRAAATGLRITLSDGTIIQEKQAKDTFIKAIKAAGPAKLLDRRIDNAEPVVSKTRHSNPNYARAQHPIEGGFLVLTQFSTKRKKELLEKLGRMPGINMNWTVEIV